jgi:hypothetical protein
MLSDQTINGWLYACKSQAFNGTNSFVKPSFLSLFLLLLVQLVISLFGLSQFTPKSVDAGFLVGLCFLGYVGSYEKS